MTSPDDPTPDDEPPPRPLLGPMFWVLMALSVFCVAAGISVAAFGPRLLGGG